MKLSENLLRIVKSKGITLAKLSRDSGVPPQTLHGWVTGRDSVNLKQLKKVASSLEVSSHSLAFGEPDPNESIGKEILKELFTGDVRVTVHRIERRRTK